MNHTPHGNDGSRSVPNLVLAAIAAITTFAFIIERVRNDNHNQQLNNFSARRNNQSSFPLKVKPNVIPQSDDCVMNIAEIEVGNPRMSKWEVGTISLRGAGHFKSGIGRQDSIRAITWRNRWIIVAIADGLSSASRADEASSSAITLTIQSLDQLFPEDNFGDVSSWALLKKYLTRSLVEKYLGQPSPTIMAETRIEAAREFATTLEVLCFDAAISDQDANPFWFIRIAGDGCLYQIIGSEVSDLVPPPGRPHVKSNNVEAIPVDDSEPKIFSGSVKLGSSIVFASDGVLSYRRDPSFTTLLNSKSGRRLSLNFLLEAITFPARRADDDRSFAIISLVSNEEN
jgi:hypothetical protein